MGRKAPHCFRHFRGRGRMLQPGKTGTKSELSARLSLRRGWPPVVLQSSRHWRHFQPKAGLCLSSPCDAPHVMPHGDCSGNCTVQLLCEPREFRVQGSFWGQLPAHPPNHSLVPFFSSSHRLGLMRGVVKEAAMDLFWAYASYLQIRTQGLSLSLSQTSSGNRGMLSQ